MDNQQQHNLSDLEDIVSELQFLSKKQPVQDDDLLRVKELMGILKESGYTNKEISTLTRENGVSPQLNCIPGEQTSKIQLPKLMPRE
jgi:hypothetical protein